MMMLLSSGAFLKVVGINWGLQGAELLAWPADSFMPARREWLFFNATTAAAGAALLGLVQWRAGR